MSRRNHAEVPVPSQDDPAARRYPRDGAPFEVVWSDGPWYDLSDKPRALEFLSYLGTSEDPVDSIPTVLVDNEPAAEDQDDGKLDLGRDALKMMRERIAAKQRDRQGE